MYELRWFKRYIEEQDINAVNFPETRIVKVLQYRYRKIEDIGKLTDFVPVLSEWSEWCDVPEADDFA